MTLPLYLTRRFLVAFAMVLGAFWGVLFLIGIVEKIRSFARIGISLAEAAWLAALSVPQSLYDILPLVMVLSGVVLFVGLARSSELVVIRAAGQSGLRMLVTPVIVAALIGVVAVAIGNPIVSATAKRYEAVADKLQNGVRDSASIGSDGVWLRQGMKNGTEQAVIHGGRANLDATVLYDVTFLIFSPEQGMIRRLSAQQATLTHQGWDLKDVKDWPIGSSTNPERDATHQAQMILPSDLTKERIRDSFGQPSAVPIWELPGYIRAIEDAGFSARRHIVWLGMELSLPVVMAAMVLIAAGFNMGHARLAQTGAMVLLTLCAGLGVFFLRNLAQVLGDNGEIPTMLAAWAPPAIAMLLALALVIAREDG